MTYAARETSKYSGQPIELYRFAQGVNLWLYTSGDVTYTKASEIYVPEVISRNEIDQNNEDGAGSIEITVPRDNAVAALWISYLPVTPVGVTIYRLHRGDSEIVTTFVGKVATVRFEDSEATITAMPISEALRRQIPAELYQRPCNHALYSAGCGVNKTAFRVTGTISSVSGATIKSPAFATKPDGWFTTGFVERSDGDIRFVMSHVGDTITLMNPFPSLAAGESMNAYAGCDRTEAMCTSKFSNLPNHLGYARIPTKSPFNGSIS
jgi:uncharacterized phage protein (TIGR02218 family)